VDSKTFTGGEKLIAALAELSKKIDKSALLKVGFQNGATYPDGTSVALVALTNEFGSPANHQPPRPFFRQMIAEHNGEWGGQLGVYLVATNYDATKSLNIMGEIMINELIDSINDFTTPELAPSTIAAKGFDKPLIDTGVMWNSITKEVE
jgi:hypothetical protein